jgi:hypothetical protein
MYSFELNIGSWISPTPGTGWVAVNPLYEKSGMVKARKADQIFARITISSPLTFYSYEYTELKALADNHNRIEIRIFYKGVQKFTGYLDLAGDYNDNELSCSLNVTPNDRYTKILAGMDTEINAIDNDITKYDVVLNVTTDVDNQYEVETGAAPTGFGAYYSNCGLVDATAWSASTQYYPAVDPPGVPTGDYQGAMNCFCKYGTINYRCTNGNTNRRPDLNPTYWAPLGSQLWEFGQERADFQFTGSTYDPGLNLYIKASCTPSNYQNTFDNCVRMFDVLEGLLNEVDATINIVETGGNEYSPYLNSGAAPCDGELANLFMSDKSDIKNYTAPDVAQFENIKLSRMLEYYKRMFNLDWKIDDNNYFKFSHPTEVTIILPTPFADYPAHYLTTFRALKWTVGNAKYKYVERKKINKERWEFEQSNSSDFDGVPIIYNNAYTDEIVYQLNSLNCNVSRVVKGDDTVSDDGFVIFATTKPGADYEVVNKAGIIRPYVTLYNGKLSTSRLIQDHHTTGDRIYKKGTVNNVANTSLVIRDDKEYSGINIPVYDPDSIDFDYLIETEMENITPWELQIKFNGDHAILKGRF